MVISFQFRVRSSVPTIIFDYDREDRKRLYFSWSYIGDRASVALARIEICNWMSSIMYVLIVLPVWILNFESWSQSQFKNSLKHLKISFWITLGERNNICLVRTNKSFSKRTEWFQLGRHEWPDLNSSSSIEYTVRYLKNPKMAVMLVKSRCWWLNVRADNGCC